MAALNSGTQAGGSKVMAVIRNSPSVFSSRKPTSIARETTPAVGSRVPASIARRMMTSIQNITSSIGRETLVAFVPLIITGMWTVIDRALTSAFSRTQPNIDQRAPTGGATVPTAANNTAPAAPVPAPAPADVAGSNNILAENEEQREQNSNTSSRRRRGELDVRCEIASVELVALSQREFFNIALEITNAMVRDGENARSMLNGLQKLKGILCNGLRNGSIIVELQVFTLPALTLLRQLYDSGQLLVIMEQALVTGHVLTEFDATSIHLRVYVDEKDFDRCRKELEDLQAGLSTAAIKTTLDDGTTGALDEDESDQKTAEGEAKEEPTAANNGAPSAAPDPTAPAPAPADTAESQSSGSTLDQEDTLRGVLRDCTKIKEKLSIEQVEKIAGYLHGKEVLTPEELETIRGKTLTRTEKADLLFEKLWTKNLNLGDTVVDAFIDAEASDASKEIKHKIQQGRAELAQSPYRSSNTFRGSQPAPADAAGRQEQGLFEGSLC